MSEGGWRVGRASPAAQRESPEGKLGTLAKNIFEGVQWSSWKITSMQASQARWTEVAAAEARGWCRWSKVPQAPVSNQPWPTGGWYITPALAMGHENGHGEDRVDSRGVQSPPFLGWLSSFEKRKTFLSFLGLPGGWWHGLRLLQLSFSIHSKLRLLLLLLLEKHLSSPGRQVKRSWWHPESHTTFYPHICAFSSAELKVSRNAHTITSFYVWNDWLGTHAAGSCAN